MRASLGPRACVGLECRSVLVPANFAKSLLLVFLHLSCTFTFQWKSQPFSANKVAQKFVFHSRNCILIARLAERTMRMKLFALPNRARYVSMSEEGRETFLLPQLS